MSGVTIEVVGVSYSRFFRGGIEAMLRKSTKCPDSGVHILESYNIEAIEERIINRVTDRAILLLPSFDFDVAQTRDRRTEARRHARQSSLYRITAISTMTNLLSRRSGATVASLDAPYRFGPRGTYHPDSNPAGLITFSSAQNVSVANRQLTLVSFTFLTDEVVAGHR